MRRTENYIMREIAGETILVPTGSEIHFNGLITLNELGSFIFRALETPLTEEELLARILDEYEVDRETALADMQAFLKQLSEMDAVC